MAANKPKAKVNKNRTKKKTVKKILKDSYKTSEWTFPKAAYQGGKKWPKEARMRDLKRLMESIGLANVHKGQLAAKYGIGRTTLYEDIERFYKAGMPKEEVQRAKVDVNKAMDFALQQAQTLVIEAGNIKDKADGHNVVDALSAMVSSKSKALRTLIIAAKEKTVQLEKWDLKEQVILDDEKAITVVINTNGNNFPKIQYPGEKASK